MKAAADAGLICSLRQEGVPLENIQTHCGGLCRCVLVRTELLSTLSFYPAVFFHLPPQAFLDVSPPGGITAGGKATEEAGLRRHGG